MSLVNINSPSQWQGLLSSTNVVVADFYADWCGPCKMIAPHYERLAKEHTKPGKVAFAKIDVDSQSSISQPLGVSAMPTFKIFHGGKCVDTIKGANPAALTEAVTRAVRLGGAGKPGASFKTPGRALGGEPLRTTGGGAGPGMVWDFNNWINTLVVFVGLYFVSLFTIDAYKSAEKSQFNVHRPPPPANVPGTGANGTRGAAAKPTFKTLADLGSE